MTAADNPVRHVHHHAYACWDSEETRHFYEDILGMPLVATIALEVEGDAMVRQYKRKLDAAGVANVLMDHGVSLSLRFNDPDGLILELMAKGAASVEYERPSRASAHSALRQWLGYRQNWWRNAASHEPSKLSSSGQR
jgi:hypothetical protein